MCVCAVNAKALFSHGGNTPFKWTLSVNDISIIGN